MDSTVLKDRLVLLGEYIEDLERIAQSAVKDSLGSKRDRRFLERTLQLALEACLDIGSHLIAESRWREPASYRDIFVILTEHGIIEQDRLDAFTGMAGLRNLLVHDYARIDSARLLRILPGGVADLRYFARRVKERFLD